MTGAQASERRLLSAYDELRRDLLARLELSIRHNSLSLALDHWAASNEARVRPTLTTATDSAPDTRPA